MKKTIILMSLIFCIAVTIFTGYHLYKGIKQEVLSIAEHDKELAPSIIPEIRNRETKEIKELAPIYKDESIWTISAYSPRECETDSTPFITANNTRVFEGGMAVSRDVLNVLGWELGDRVHIPALDRTFTLNDKMNKRWKLRGDIFFFSTKEAKEFGVLTKVKVFRIKNSEDA